MWDGILDRGKGRVVLNADFYGVSRARAVAARSV